MCLDNSSGPPSVHDEVHVEGWQHMRFVAVGGKRPVFIRTATHSYVHEFLVPLLSEGGMRWAGRWEASLVNFTS
eukprot:12904507-Prorocentrum_lima.AAC.1